jgi:hypothetical protein
MVGGTLAIELCAFLGRLWMIDPILYIVYVFLRILWIIYPILYIVYVVRHETILYVRDVKFV